MGFFIVVVVEGIKHITTQADLNVQPNRHKKDENSNGSEHTPLAVDGDASVIIVTQAQIQPEAEHHIRDV